MKKLLIVFLCCLAFGLSATDMSAGLMVRLNAEMYSEGATDPVFDEKGYYTQTKYMTGIMGYFDISALQLAIGYESFSFGTYKLKNWTPGTYNYTSPGYFSMDSNGGGAVSQDDLMVSYLPLQAMFKIPIDLGGITLFPTFGIEYKLLLQMLNANGDDMTDGLSARQVADLNEFFIKAGAGLDIPLTDQLYLRGQLLLGYMIPSANQLTKMFGNGFLYDAAGYKDWYINTLSADLSVGLGLKF